MLTRRTHQMTDHPRSQSATTSLHHQPEAHAAAASAALAPAAHTDRNAMRSARACCICPGAGPSTAPQPPPQTPHRIRLPRPHDSRAPAVSPSATHLTTPDAQILTVLLEGPANLQPLAASRERPREAARGRETGRERP
eukprot:3372151-Prymnesium_polylepis.1